MRARLCKPAISGARPAGRGRILEVVLRDVPVHDQQMPAHQDERNVGDSYADDARPRMAQLKKNMNRIRFKGITPKQSALNERASAHD